MHTVFCLENLKGRDNFKDLGVDGKIILDWILEKYGGKMWSGFVWHRTEISGGLLKIW